MKDFYAKNIKQMLVIPIILLVAMLYIVFIYPGLVQGVDLTGGTIINVRYDNEVSVQSLEESLNKFNLVDLKVSTLISPTSYGAIIQYSKNPKILGSEEELALAERTLENEEESITHSKNAAQELGLELNNYKNAKDALIIAQNFLTEYKETYFNEIKQAISTAIGSEQADFQIREVSPTLGTSSLNTAISVGFVATILILLVVFVFFRKIVPSLAIILSAAFDILAGLAGMSLLGIPLSLASIPALLMLVGYSIDTDIMLTHRLLNRRGGKASERATESMKTGLTMTGTTLAALVGMVILSNLYGIEVIYHISSVLFIGLIGDLIATWFMNAPILLIYLGEKKWSFHKVGDTGFLELLYY